MKRALLLAAALYLLTCGTGIARAVDVQSSPADHPVSASATGNNKPANVGPHDPEKGKPHGMGVNVFLSKGVAVNGSVSLLSPEPSVLSGQPDQAGMTGGLGLRPSRVGGAVAFKLFF